MDSLYIECKGKLLIQRNCSCSKDYESGRSKSKSLNSNCKTVCSYLIDTFNIGCNGSFAI